MKLTKLLEEMKYEIKNFKNINITGIVFDTEKIKPGCLFVCLKGSQNDGHDFVKEAVRRGAKAIACEHTVDVFVPQIIFVSTREALAALSAAFYEHPEKDFKLVAITGTNGKTTTSFLIKQILQTAGMKTGLIGTTGVYINDILYASKLTTPDPVDLFETFSKMKKAGVQAVVMEASAHALYLKKLFGLVFDAAVFTNLTQDHMDFFHTMEAYGNAKKQLFDPYMSRKAVININDTFGNKLCSIRKTGLISYGMQDASILIKNVKTGIKGSVFEMSYLGETQEVFFKLPGLFNVYNATAAAGACLALGLSLTQVVQGIASMNFVPGRFNVLDFNLPFHVVIDYAHTPDGLENILKTAKLLTRNALICVFGCGGNRDNEKRSLMGQIAARLCDYVVLTSDNPRFEDPDKILAQIEEGTRLVTKNYKVLEKRKEAIRYAMQMAMPGDVIVIAGKGHEDYQDIQGVKHPFNDAVVAEGFAHQMQKQALSEKQG